MLRLLGAFVRHCSDWLAAECLVARQLSSHPTIPFFGYDYYIMHNLDMVNFMNSILGIYYAEAAFHWLSDRD
jgi:hypothetical protein